MKNLLIVILLLLLIVLYGCVTAKAKAVMLTDATYHPKPEDFHIQVLLEEPAKPYKKIAIVEIIEEVDENSADLVSKLIKKCRLIGADALILEKPGKV